MISNNVFEIVKIIDPEVYTYGPWLDISFALSDEQIEVLRKKLELIPWSRSEAELYWFDDIEINNYRTIDPTDFPPYPSTTVLEIHPEGYAYRLSLRIPVSWQREIDLAKIAPIADVLEIEVKKIMIPLQAAMNDIFKLVNDDR